MATMRVVASAPEPEGYGFNRDVGNYHVYGMADLARVFALALEVGLPSIDAEGVASMTAQVEAGKRDAKHFIEMYTARLAKFGVDINAGAPKDTDARAEEAAVRGGLAFSAPGMGGAIKRSMSQRAVKAQHNKVEERFMDLATSGVDDDLDDYYEQMAGRKVERKQERAVELDEEDEPEDEGDGGASAADDSGSDDMGSLAGSVSTILMGTDDMQPAVDHPTLRLRSRRRPTSASSVSLGALDVSSRARNSTRSSASRARRRQLRGASARPSTAQAQDRRNRSSADLYKQPGSDEGGPARVTVQTELKMDSPRDGTDDGYTKGNPMMAALTGGSRSQDFHKSMSHHQLNLLLHSFGMSVTKGQVEQIVSRSYRFSSGGQSARYSPPRERSPSPTERDFVASFLNGIKGADCDRSGSQWSRVTKDASSRHSEAFSMLSEESSLSDDYQMDRCVCMLFLCCLKCCFDAKQ